jgi:chemotaxis protein CheD
LADFVQAGERRIGKGKTVLSVLGLGSCIVVVLYDGEARIGGLAHILLPDPTHSQHRQVPWRFATTAVPALLGELEMAGADRRRMTARIVGGAGMLRELAPPDGIRIGERNVAAARSALARHGIEIIAEDVGGDNGRSLHFHLEDGRVRVARHGKSHVEL